MTEQLPGGVTLYSGNCLDALATLDEHSIDSCVTDPPYHLQSIVKRFAKTGRTDKTRTTSGPHQRTANGFMNKQWDGGDIAFRPETWAKIYRVLKPGSYLVAFSSTRTFGRMSVAIEDAGFITHPFIAWIFGQGFPKAHRVEHEDWDGWSYGTQSLKPAIEPIFVGQKPFEKNLTGTANVLKWGTGALNINGCRIAYESETDKATALSGDAFKRKDTSEKEAWARPWMDDPEKVAAINAAAKERAQNGRWPANVILDGSAEVADVFPDAPGQQQDIDPHAPSAKTGNVYGKMNREGEPSAERRYTENGSTNFAALPGQRRNDSGSAARFFYTAKADADDRLGSKHPTVKPLDLMQWLVRLVTPPKGLIIDPFAGTGTTGEAAIREGFRTVLIEREEEYQNDIRRRMKLAMAGPDERAREGMKARMKDKPVDDGPLFEQRESWNEMWAKPYTGPASSGGD